MNFADIFSRTASALLFAACIGIAWMMLRLARHTSATLPTATTSPPCTPAPGPISTI